MITETFSIKMDNDIKLAIPQYYMIDDLFLLTKRNHQFLSKWLPWVKDFSSNEDTKNFITLCLEQIYRNEGFQCVIICDNQIIGLVGFHQIKKNPRIGHVGYWLDEDFNGRGIMTKCVSYLIKFGFLNLGLEKIEIRCARQNTKSRAIPGRLSFTEEGTIRCAGFVNGEFTDHVIFGLLRTEWELQQNYGKY